MSGLIQILSKGKEDLDVLNPSGKENEGEWVLLWNATTLFRWALNVVGLWGTDFSSPFLANLDPWDRVNRADKNDRFAIIGSDATEWSAAAILFQENLGVRRQLPRWVSEEIRRLAAPKTRRGPTKRGQALFMGITEFVGVITGLTQWAPRLKDSLVIVVTDSLNVFYWIRTRTARNKFAQSLLRLMVRLEILGSFVVWSERVSSEENDLPDCLSRLQDREGAEIPAEHRRWLLLNEHRKDGPIQIQEPVGDFPVEWFQHPADSQLNLLLPGENR